jgi:hypothetical protein
VVGCSANISILMSLVWPRESEMEIEPAPVIAKVWARPNV